MGCGVKTTCPYCGVGCGVVATPAGDGTVAIAGDETHPANFGRLCSKGSALGETVDLDGRLLHPTIDGAQADWDDALDMVAARFKQTIAEHGPDSVAFYVSGQILTEDYYVANKLMKGYIGSANIDTNSRLCMASSVAGHRRAFGTDTVPGTYQDLELANVIVLVGSNLLWCHPVLYQRIAAAKKQRPSMQVVLIDPRRTKTADIADIHLAIEPDSDTALFNGLLTWLANHDELDSVWIEQHTEGFSAALEKASSQTIESVSTSTGLTKSEVEAFYALWTGTEKVVTAYSQGVNQSACGTDKVNAIINCHLATARIGKPGMGPFSLTGQPNAMGGREVGGLASMLAAHMNIEDAAHRDIVQRFWQSPTMCEKPGLKAVDMFDAVADGRIKALWVMATNPAVSMPEAKAVEAAIANCPFVVVSDVMASTDTLRHAHVALPALAWGEKSGTVTNSERRISRQRAFLPAPGETKADWWQLAQVGQRMGWQYAFDWVDESAIFDEYAAMTAFENDGARDLDIGGMSGMSQADYDALQPVQWPQPKTVDPEHETRFFAEGGFFTPSRKARFIPVDAPVLQAHVGTLRLNTGRVRDHWHTMTRTGKAARLSNHMAEPYCELNPSDASRLGITDADLVTVSNALGSITVRAMISDGQQQGSVFVPMHWNDQTASDGRVDALVKADTDPFSGQPASKGSQVFVEPAKLAQHGFALCANLPDTSALDYWALAKTDNGWRLEFANEHAVADPIGLLETITRSNREDALEAVDNHLGFARFATFSGSQLTSAGYLSSGPVPVSRSWACDLLIQDHNDLSARWRVLAGRPAADMPDKGAIVCACMSVGVNDITGAVQSGCISVEAVGEATQAGTNCGSCKAEITEIINAHRLIAAE